MRAGLEERAMPRPASPEVRAILARRGIPLTEMARRLGLTRGVLYNALRTGPTWPRLRRQLAELLDVDEAVLFPEDAEPPTGTAA